MSDGAPNAHRDVDAFVAAITTGAAALPESRVLDPMVGTFAVTTEWEPVVGRGLRRSRGRCEGAWVYGGRMLDTIQFDEDGIEVARHSYAYDAMKHDYVAFTVTVMSIFYEVERGHYAADEQALILEADEPLRGENGPELVRIRRTVQFVNADRYTVGISYPGSPPTKYGPMYVTFDRI